MTGVILVGVLNVLMFIWFGYQFSQDKANLWKRRPRPTETQTGEAPPADEPKD